MLVFVSNNPLISICILLPFFTIFFLGGGGINIISLIFSLVNRKEGVENGKDPPGCQELSHREKFSGFHGQISVHFFISIMVYTF